MTVFYVFKLLSEILNTYNNSNVINYTLIIGTGLLFLSALKKNEYKIRINGLLGGSLFLIIVLFIGSYLRNPVQDALKVCIVFFAGVLLFFAFSIMMTEKKMIYFFDTIWITMIFVFFVNLIFVINGKGRTEWGISMTLKGCYYYKTDYATFLLQFLIVARYKLVKNKSLNIHNKIEKRINNQIFLNSVFIWVMIIFGSVLIFFTNSRVFLIALFIYFAIIYYDLNGKDIRSVFTLKTIIVFVCAISLAIMMLNYLSQRFPNLNLLGFDVDDAMSEKNTQGRSVIWAGIYDYMTRRATFMQKIFGVDMVTSSLVNDKGMRAHSLFFYVWYSFGAVGVVAFIVFFVSILHRAWKSRNPIISYMLLLSLCQTIIAGLSQEVITNTQQTWFMFIILGITVAEQQNNTFYLKKD